MYRTPLAVKGVSFLGALLLVLVPGLAGLQHAAHAQTPDAVKIRVETTDSGFKPDTIEVEQGKLVELTFVWAHQAYPREQHIMVLEGYKLESDKITSERREATIRFVADKPGTFNFKCDLDCELHDHLQNGSLKVRSGGGGGAGAAARVPTKISVSPSATVTGGGIISVLAVLKDDKGAAVPKAEVRFLLDADFFGTKGPVVLGTAKTDANGTAAWYYQPTVDMPQHNIIARFEGMGVYGESQEAVAVQQVGAPPPAYVMAPLGLDDAPGFPIPTSFWLGSGPPSWVLSAWSWSFDHWGPVMIALLVVGVWLTLVYTAGNVYLSIRKTRI